MILQGACSPQESVIGPSDGGPDIRLSSCISQTVLARRQRIARALRLSVDNNGEFVFRRLKTMRKHAFLGNEIVKEVMLLLFRC